MFVGKSNASFLEFASINLNLANDAETMKRRVESFTRLLVEPPKREAVRNSAGVLDPPLGATRLSEYTCSSMLF